MNCRVCGAELPEGAIFCGDCGSAVHAAPLTRSAVSDVRPSDTTILDEAALVQPVIIDLDAELAAQAVIEADLSVESLLASPAEPDAAVSPTDSAGLPPEPVTAAPSAQTVRHVLTSSTGERVVVLGPGLLGRRPAPGAGEDHLQLVALADVTRSVSKTHLEFGVEAGELWILDRYSANGTVMIGPDGGRRECEPGRRYRVVPGTRLELGEQTLVVD